MEMRSRRGEKAYAAVADEHEGRRARRGGAALGCTHARIAVGIVVIVVLIASWSHGLGAWVLLRTTLVRPPVRDDDPRQLLVVGTQSSGTTGMTDSLKQLGLEVEHENSNSAETLCRDGTVSWFHGIRFFPGRASDASLDALCRRAGSRTGFHPRMFRNARSCWAEWFGWGDCWAQTCREVLAENWGCAHAADSPCETPFARALLQVRHPLRVVESLGVKFCASADAPLNRDLAALLAGLWPADAARFGPPDAAPSTDAARAEPRSSGSRCLVALGWYWTLYHESLLAALKSGVLHGWYRIESTPSCEVAKRAGFDSTRTALFAPAAARYARACAEGVPAPSARKRTNQRNRGLLHIEPSEIDALDAELGRRMRALARQFGYSLGGDEALARAARNGTVGARDSARAGDGVGQRTHAARLKLRRGPLTTSNDWRTGPQLAAIL